MANDNNNAFSDIWGKMNEAQRINREEREIRYASRRSEKIAVREKVEGTAIKLCGAIEAALDEERGPNDIAALAAALSGMAAAMHAAESYAESIHADV